MNTLLNYLITKSSYQMILPCGPNVEYVADSAVQDEPEYLVWDDGSVEIIALDCYND